MPKRAAIWATVMSAVFEQGADNLDLFSGEFGRAATLAAADTSGCKAGNSSFADKVAFDQGGENVEDEAACWRTRFDLLRQRFKADLALFLCPSKPDQEGALGAGQYPQKHLHPRLHRRSRPRTERAESAQPRRGLPPDAARDLLCGLRQIPCEDRSGAANLERMLPPDRQRDHLLQHPASFGVYEQKLAAGDLEAVKVLKSTSPVAWCDVNLIGNFDFTTSSTPVDIEALAARYQNEDFWRLSMQEGDEESPE
jgi:hypothetical protein